MATQFIGDYECSLTKKALNDCPRYMCFSILKPSRLAYDVYDEGIHFKYLGKCEFLVEHFRIETDDSMEENEYEYVMNMLSFKDHLGALSHLSHLLESIPPSDFVRVNSFIQTSLKNFPIEGSF